MGGELNIENVGAIQVKCYVLQNLVRQNPTTKEWTNNRRRYHGGAEIQVIVNGQQHGLINKALYCRKTVGLEHLTDDLFIILDATNISIRGKEALFLGSRDRLSEGKEKLALEDALLTWLKDNDTLHILNEEKKRKELEKAIKDTTVSQDVFKNLVKQNPILAEIFPDIGFQIPRNKGFEWTKTKGKYHGQKTPSFFRLEKGEKTFNIVCPMNKSPKIVFEHDALNDYFTRNVRPAKLTISVYDNKKKTYVKKTAMIKSRSTDDGITNVRIQPLSTSKIGDKLTVQIQLTDKKFSDEPIVFKGKMRFIKKTKISEFALVFRDEGSTHVSLDSL